MSHFVAYILQFQEIIGYKIPPGGRGSIASLRSNNRLCWATFSAGASWIITWLGIDVLLVLQQLWG